MESCYPLKLEVASLDGCSRLGGIGHLANDGSLLSLDLIDLAIRLPSRVSIPAAWLRLAPRAVSAWYAPSGPRRTRPA